jgi:hypothetical protein
VGVEADAKWSIVRADEYNTISKMLFLWPIYRGPTEFSSPSIDHTKGTGDANYLVLSSRSPNRFGQTAWLKTPSIQIFNSNLHPSISPVIPECTLRLFYFMSGAGAHSLNVYVRTRNDLSSLVRVWSINGKQGPHWHRVHIDAPLWLGNQAFEFIIEGIVGKQDSGDVSIDDISLTDSCIVVPSTLPTAPTSTPMITTTTRRPPSSVCTNVTRPYECRLDHTCLPDYVRCNFVWDCYLGEDEFGCVPPIQTFNNTNRYLQLQQDLPQLNFSVLGNIRNLSIDIVC